MWVTKLCNISGLCLHQLSLMSMCSIFLQAREVPSAASHPSSAHKPPTDATRCSKSPDNSFYSLLAWVRSRFTSVGCLHGIAAVSPTFLCSLWEDRHGIARNLTILFPLLPAETTVSPGKASVFWAGSSPGCSLPPRMASPLALGTAEDTKMDEGFPQRRAKPLQEPQGPRWKVSGPQLQWWPPNPWSSDTFAVPAGRSLACVSTSSSSQLAESLNWALPSLLHLPHVRVSHAAAQQQKMVIQVIKTPEVMGKGCFPPGETSQKNSI